ncbi:hypothetical protein EHI8A_232320 [Entamoeba histolytica HM-1:IMSS-B]|uniref:RING-type domain-containing protein n=5 Tax=Entamoeba histolytica TaxID=5759 RepID=C4M9B1_ENTH1|nr:hypothetical protein EHI_193090 [Entamoeba histolytica HM-1:IMSS]EMD43007.1 Hypothetical protein EHI5A_233990 [Entamoeba histolytica KU27]EMH77088.1 hypothetical protein EHI8A_232320 [Entamoeba histolytica HM-1:IMSS-B]EMS15641.1 hypothetical protein KM1_294090 [Entamoeba histolytica HM-3:IMSS]GAT98245.1 hypothetical protein CL6EHI_193090 [Entamoeba histolytica]EAL43986.1 hypothetical protein EHI_193090 [Entamoeba histolytica HM-1:IMSS]|eukprot:XP_649367.1 hypothetical protein EHI_193090 [Entamoeba histolytica HM-1:IMSS]
MSFTNRPTIPARTIIDSIRSGRLNQVSEPLLGQNTITQEYLTILIHTMAKDPTRLQTYLDRLDFTSNNLDIEKTIFELIEAGMSENAKKFAEKRSPGSYIKILLRSAISSSPYKALEIYGNIISYIDHQQYINKVELIKVFGKTIVDALLDYKEKEESMKDIKRITSILISLFLDKPSSAARLDPGEFLHVMENCQSELDEFLKKIQSKFSESTTQNDKVNELLIEMDLKDESDKQKNKAIMLYKSREHKQEHIKNLFFQKRILDEVVNDPDEKLLCLLQEHKTDKIDESMDVGIHYLPLICMAEKDNNEHSIGFENVLKGIFQENNSEHTAPHKIISVLEILSRPEIIENIKFDQSVKESLKNGLSFIDEIPTLRESIEERQKNLTEHLVFRQTRCAACGQEFKDTEADYPIIHFHCGHSYHKKCFTNSKLECTKDHGPSSLKEIGETEFERAINTTEFQGFYELINSVSSVLGIEEDIKADKLEDLEDNNSPKDIQDNLQEEPDEEVDESNKFLEKTKNYNPFLTADTSTEAMNYDHSSAYTGSQFENADSQNDPFYSALF